MPISNPNMALLLHFAGPLLVTPPSALGQPGGGFRRAARARATAMAGAMTGRQCRRVLWVPSVMSPELLLITPRFLGSCF